MSSASPARIAANRLNAQKSTGPRTDEGKARSRENALRHGLAGAGMVVPPDLEAEVEAEFRTVRAEMRPQTTLGTFLLHQATLASVRCRRAARQESAALARRVRDATADWDDARAVEADHAFEALRDDPAAARRRLLRTPEGTTRLIEALTDLRRDLGATAPTWDAAKSARLEALCGRPSDALVPSSTAALARAVLGDARGLEPASIAHLPSLAAIQLWARQRLAEAVVAEVARLAERFEEFDFAAIEADRAEAPDRALFDPGPEATLARRYEAASSRLFFRAFREFRAAEADALDRAGLGGPAPGYARSIAPAVAQAVAPPPQPPPTPARRRPVDDGPHVEFVDLAAGRGADDPTATEALGSFGAGADAPNLGRSIAADRRCVALADEPVAPRGPTLGEGLDPGHLRSVVRLLI